LGDWAFLTTVFFCGTHVGLFSEPQNVAHKKENSKFGNKASFFSRAGSRPFPERGNESWAPPGRSKMSPAPQNGGGGRGFPRAKAPFGRSVGGGAPRLDPARPPPHPPKPNERDNWKPGPLLLKMARMPWTEREPQKKFTKRNPRGAPGKTFFFPPRQMTVPNGRFFFFFPFGAFPRVPPMPCQRQEPKAEKWGGPQKQVAPGGWGAGPVVAQYDPPPQNFREKCPLF